MNTKERNFSNTLKKHMLEAGILLDKIESRLTTAGVPDLLLSMKGYPDCHMELKIIECEGPKKNQLHLTPGQVSWHAKRLLHDKVYPFVCLVEQNNCMVVISSKKAIDIAKAGGKINIGDIHDQCFITRNKEGYTELINAAICNLNSSQRVYK